MSFTKITFDFTTEPICLQAINPDDDLKCTRKVDYILKLNVMAKKSRFEIKKILKEAAFLLETKLRGEFRKSKAVGQQRIILLRGVVPANLTQFRSFLGPMKNIVKISFVSNPEIEAKIRKKHKNNEEISKKTKKSTTRHHSKKSFGPKEIQSSSI